MRRILLVHVAGEHDGVPPPGPLDAIRSRMDASMQSLRSSLVEAQAQARVLGCAVGVAEAHAGAIRTLSGIAADRPRSPDAPAEAPGLDDVVAQASTRKRDD